MTEAKVHIPAVQLLSPRGVVQRIGWCPDHGNRTSKWMGVQPSLLDGEASWTFRCKAPDHAPHLFNSPPDPHAPAVGQEEKWLAQQRLNLALEKDRRKK